MASASSEIRQRVKTLVNNMNDVQKIAIVAALILPFFFREEWDNLTRFYQRLIDFEDYSALLGAWLVCAVVYYLWRPNVDSERSPKND